MFPRLCGTVWEVGSLANNEEPECAFSWAMLCRNLPEMEMRRGGAGRLREGGPGAEKG